MRRILLVASLTVMMISLASSQTGGLKVDHGKIHRIGLLSDVNYAADGSPWLEAFKQRLQALGYMEGQNLILEKRNAQRDHGLLDKFAAELVSLKVEVIVTSSTTAATAAKNATKTIPIVFWGADPISSGLVRDLKHPGENLTGITTDPGSQARNLRLLKATTPELSRVAILFNQSYSPVPGLLKKAERAARSLRLRPQLVEVKDPKDLDEAFSAMIREHADAVYVLNHVMFAQERVRLTNLAIKNHLPMMAPYKTITEAGSLLGYDLDFQQPGRRAANFVDKILKGTKPGDLSVDQSVRQRFLINLKTAKALGITIPQAVLRQADEVIQ